MRHEIEIIDGPEQSSYFYFVPVKVNSTYKIEWEDIEAEDDLFAIEEGYVECFLAYFLFKYFDEELIYNKERFDGVYLDGFAWWLDDNFFTYDQIEKMCVEIEECAKLLDTDFYNEKLDKVKERMSIFYMCNAEDDDYKNRDNSDEAKKRNIKVVINFYHRFVERIRKMMRDNPDVNLISISGP